MRIDRDDLVFCTCYQLAGHIQEDWEGYPEKIKGALLLLGHIDDPEDTVIIGNPATQGLNLPELPISEEARKLRLLAIAKEGLKLILLEADAWKTENSDALKKEIISRTKRYEDCYNRLLNPPKPKECCFKL